MELNGLSSQSQSLLNSLAAGGTDQTAQTDSEETTTVTQPEADSVEISEEAEALDQLDSALPSLIAADNATSILSTINNGESSGTTNLLNLANAQALSESQLGQSSAEDALSSVQNNGSNDSDLLSLIG
ncbi:hypothetical protein [Acanthopleuribacter pedis]|uniref:Uncharacterized protein n=1 Tax=Acanthopleuribacter pedis TaxID=442870 RepID=A0A8J7QNU2_9BACT|nr:hypothetical protein [Acanthopleuribacter pedis]MBO1322535.1 hypothetical protein [Acanthopleuribacter pedis]